MILKIFPLQQQLFYLKTKNSGHLFRSPLFPTLSARSKIITKGTAKVYFRISEEDFSKDNNGLIQDKKVNVCFRTHIFANPSVISTLIAAKNDKFFLTYLLPIIDGINRGTKNVFSNRKYKPRRGLDSLIPTRVAIYASTNDPFFSIAVGYRFPPQFRSASVKADICYNISRAGFENNIFVYLTKASNTHKSTGIWDLPHCDRQPLFNFDADFCNKNFKKPIEEYFNQEKGTPSFLPKGTKRPSLLSIQNYLNDTLTQVPMYQTRKTNYETTQKTLQSTQAAFLTDFALNNLHNKFALLKNFATIEANPVAFKTAKTAFFDDYKFFTAKSKNIVTKTAFLAGLIDVVEDTNANISRDFTIKFEAAEGVNERAAAAAATLKLNPDDSDVQTRARVTAYAASHANQELTKVEKAFFAVDENQKQVTLANAFLLNFFEAEAASYVKLAHQAATFYIYMQEVELRSEKNPSMGTAEATREAAAAFVKDAEANIKEAAATMNYPPFSRSALSILGEEKFAAKKEDEQIPDRNQSSSQPPNELDSTSKKSTSKKRRKKLDDK